MKDWYAFKDPRQFYYGSYTTTRARQQEALDRQLDFVDKRELLSAMPLAARRQLVDTLVPLRHYEFGANMNNAHIAGYGYGTALTQAAMMNCMDRLGMAQHISRIGLLTDGNTGESLDQARQRWMEAPTWQGLRREMENLFVVQDPMQTMLAQNLVGDALIYPLFFRRFDAEFAQANGPALSSLTDYLMRWYEETARWVDAVIRIAAGESAENTALLSGWAVHWRNAWTTALQPLVEEVFADAAPIQIDEVVAAFDARAAKLGLKL
jgi:phenol hydroxylase P1 protein